MTIYLTVFAGTIYHGFRKLFFGDIKHGYYSLWRVAYSTLNLLMYNHSSREDCTDEHGGYNMRTVAIKYKDLFIMRERVIPVIESYMKKKREEGVECIWQEEVKEKLKLPEKYVQNYFESSSAITLNEWQPHERHRRNYSCYYYNFVDLFFLTTGSDRLMKWWFGTVNKSYLSA